MTSSVQARRRRRNTVEMAPRRMMGLRRPKRVRRRSLRAPMRGPMKAPERGMEMMMAAVEDLERWRDWR